MSKCKAVLDSARVQNIKVKRKLSSGTAEKKSATLSGSASKPKQ